MSYFFLDFDHEEFLEFLEYNGHDFSDYEAESKRKKNIPDEVFTGTKAEIKDSMYASNSSREEEWADVKSKVMAFNEGEVENPLKSRLDHGVNQLKELKGLDEESESSLFVMVQFRVFLHESVGRS